MKRLMTLTAAALVALPAGAQTPVQQSAITASRVGSPAPADVTDLAPSNLVPPQNSPWTGLVRDLQIEALPGPDATTFGVGPGSHCAHTPGASGGVEFYNVTGTYSSGQAIATACPTWTARKCSRSVTFMGKTFTANKGYPRCSEASDDVTPLTGEYTGNTPNQQDSSFTPTRTPSNGIFRVRIWGNYCLNRGRGCRSFREAEGWFDTEITRDSIHRSGYGATFGPAPNCGPARWPSEAWRVANGVPYAEYCDVTVDVRK